MVALQIRDVPEDVRDALADRARSRGQSLQAFLLSVVQEEARRSRNLDLLERFAERSDGSNLTAEESIDGVAEGRLAREDQLVDGHGPPTGGTP